MIIPLTGSRKDIWLQNKLRPASVGAYIKENFAEVRGPLDVSAFRARLLALAAAQPALRACVDFGSNEACCSIGDRAPWTLREHGHTGMGWDAQREYTRQIFREIVADYSRGESPAFSFHLIRIGPELHLFYFTAHHLFWDAKTSNMFNQDFFGVISRVPAAAGAPAGLSAADYAALFPEEGEARPADEIDLHYWRETFHKDPGPAGQPSEAMSRNECYSVDVFRCELPHDLSGAFRKAFSSHRVSPLQLFTAVFAHFYGAHTGCNPVPILVPTHGRAKGPGEKAYGCFVRILPVLAEWDADDSVDAFIKRVALRTVEAQNHGGPALGDIFRAGPWAAGNHPFDVMINFKDLDYPLFSGNGLEIQVLDIPKISMDYLLNVNVSRSGPFVVEFEYNTTAITRGGIRTLAEDFSGFAQRFLASKGTLLKDLDLRPDGLATRSEDTGLNVPSIPDLLEIFALHGAKPALLHADGSLTYAQLSILANRYAAALKEAGARPGEKIGIFRRTGPDAIAAILGVWSQGCAYVPAPPDLPKARRHSLIAQCNLRFAFSETGIDEPDIRRLEPTDATEPLSEWNPGTESYVLYTSGSSGTPKGVVGSASGLWNRLAWQWSTHPYASDEVASHKTSLYWVDSLAEIFAPLFQGMPLAIFSEEQVKDGRALLDGIRDRCVTRLTCVPSLVDALLEFKGASRSLASLKVLNLSGEGLSLKTLRRIRAALPAVQILNIYGMSEAAADSTVYEIPEGFGEPEVPIGTALRGHSLYILDPLGREVPDGVRGEIHIAGAGLCLGYLSHPSPFRALKRGGKFVLVFPTGDLGRRDTGGVFHYLGRKDGILKIRGMRIHPLEIEQVILGIPGVVRACVRPSPGRSDSLTAYYSDAARSAAGDSGIAPGAIAVPVVAEALATALPPHQLPDCIVKLDIFPLLPNGKIDRNSTAFQAASEAALLQATEGTEAAFPESDELADLWRQVLQLKTFSPDRTFFELGGHSLIAVGMSAEMENRWGVKIPPIQVLVSSYEKLRLRITGAVKGVHEKEATC